MDGTGNRVPALIFGPAKVIVMAGMNKVAVDVEAAIARVRNTAAPANSLRVGVDTPCSHTWLPPGPLLPAAAPHLLPARGHPGQHDPRLDVTVVLVGESWQASAEGGRWLPAPSCASAHVPGGHRFRHRAHPRGGLRAPPEPRGVRRVPGPRPARLLYRRVRERAGRHLGRHPLPRQRLHRRAGRRGGTGAYWAPAACSSPGRWPTWTAWGP